MLSEFDLAICASTSREFAVLVANERSTVDWLLLPAGMPYMGLTAYLNDSCMSFWFLRVSRA